MKNYTCTWCTHRQYTHHKHVQSGTVQDVDGTPATRRALGVSHRREEGQRTPRRPPPHGAGPRAPGADRCAHRDVFRSRAAVAKNVSFRHVTPRRADALARVAATCASDGCGITTAPVKPAVDIHVLLECAASTTATEPATQPGAPAPAPAAEPARPPAAALKRWPPRRVEYITLATSEDATRLNACEGPLYVRCTQSASAGTA